MVDYSKWDKFELAESDEGSEDEVHPRVTKLGDGATVQIGPNGARVFNIDGEILEVPNSSNTGSSKKVPTSESSSSSSSFPNSSSNTSDSTNTKTSVKTTKDDRGLITTNGGSTDKFSWSQNRYEVTVQAILPAGTKASELSFAVDERFLSVSINNELFFGGELAHSIKVDPEDNISGGVVWELKDYGTNPDAGRLLEFTLTKHSPIEDSFQWWKHIYPGDDPIDTTKIQGRSLKVSKLKQDWDKAHADFKDYIKNFQPTLIDESDQQVYEELNRKQPSDDSLDFIIDEIERESRKSDAATNKTNYKKESSRPGSVFDPNIEGETPEERAEILKKKHDWYHNNTIEDVMAYNGGR